MQITATVTVRSERADGSATTIADTVVLRHGDNPAFEVSGIEQAIADATARVTGRVRG